MPVPIRKSNSKVGRKISCDCGRCSKCQTRQRVEKWREGQKDLAAREIDRMLKMNKGEHGD